MSDNYRVHYKKGDTEIEVESTDKNYVDSMLAKLTELRPKVHVTGQRRKSHNKEVFAPAPLKNRQRMKN